MAAEIPCTVLNPINCYRDNFHTSNTNLMAVCENNISVIRIETNLYLFLSCEITVSSSAENILHMTGMQSHVTIPCTSLCTLHFPNSLVKENKYSVLYTQNATLTRIIEKPFSRRERNFFFTVAPSAPDGDFNEWRDGRSPVAHSFRPISMKTSKIKIRHVRSGKHLDIRCQRPWGCRSFMSSL